MKLNVLLIEDSDDDAMLLLAELQAHGYQLDYERVISRQGMLDALSRRKDWDIIISDHNLPGFSSTEALYELLKREIYIPLIIVSGTIGEEMAVEVMKAGAYDYVMKGNLSRLAPAISNALKAADAKRRADDYQERLRELSMHLESVREQERAMIARDIHDEIGGLLTALKMDTRWLQKRFSGQTNDADDKFMMMGEHLDNAIKSVRRIITDLRPSVLDDLGLVAALEWQLEDFCKRYEMECSFKSSLDAVNLASKNHEVAVFRIFQESLTNIARHARANRIKVELQHDRGDDAIRLLVHDNGVGISDMNKVKKGSYGILGMNERATSLGGHLSVDSGVEGGTSVSLSLPVMRDGGEE